MTLEALEIRVDELQEENERLRAIEHQFKLLNSIRPDAPQLMQDRKDAERWRRVAGVMAAFDAGGPEYDIADVFDVIRDAMGESGND